MFLPQTCVFVHKQSYLLYKIHQFTKNEVTENSVISATVSFSLFWIYTYFNACHACNDYYQPILTWLRGTKKWQFYRERKSIMNIQYISEQVNKRFAAIGLRQSHTLNWQLRFVGRRVNTCSAGVQWLKQFKHLKKSIKAFFWMQKQKNKTLF